MKRTLLAATIMASMTAMPVLAQTITPGQGSITDSSGNVWTITANGSIREGQTWTPGGGGTSALSIVNGTVFGEDSSGRGWFTLSSDGQYWTHATAPSSAAAGPAIASSTTTDATQTVLAACEAVPGSAAFGILNGVIYGPDQKPFIPRGINVMEGQQPSASQILAAFPGTTFVRLAIYDYPSPDALAPYINDLTSHGIIVELENHNNAAGNAGGSQGLIFTGALLAQESAWYASVASAFKTNPYVWFGTNNEPSTTPSMAALSTWQGQTYDAIRGTGNLAPILLEVNGWADPASFGSGYTASVYARMTNIVGDVHFYGWLTKDSTDQSYNNQFLTAAISATQKNIVGAAGTIPVIIGEYGNSGDNMAVAINGTQVVNAVGASGVGSAAWVWEAGTPSDDLASGSTYAKQVAGIIQSAPKASGAAPAGCAATATASNNASLSATASGSSATQPATPADNIAQVASVQRQTQQVQRQIADLQAQADAILAAIPPQ